jgi:hypothetical protein
MKTVLNHVTPPHTQKYLGTSSLLGEVILTSTNGGGDNNAERAGVKVRDYCYSKRC